MQKPMLVLEPEYSKEELRMAEFNSYGMYISNHPASLYKGVKLNQLEKYLFKNIHIYVLVENIKKIKTKKNDDMAFIRCSDEIASAEFTVFPKIMPMLANIKIGNMVEINGRVSKSFDKISVIVENIRRVG